MRKSGILLPVSSLPSRYGIGCFSKEAYKFIDRLKEAGQAYWQILPLGPTSYGDSPYQSFSTFAGNPYFIDPEDLVARGYVTAEQCNTYDFGTDIHSVDYGKIYKSRFRLLKEAFDNSHIEEDARFQEFVQKNAYWLEDYALYMAIKDGFRGICWAAWEEDIKLRTPAAMDKYRRKYAKEIMFYQFQQYLFQVQWEKLKTYANDNGIKIIGDIPIYVAFDSADSWSRPELFQFDENNMPGAVAGCPPDGFSATGQLWGNPLYNWEYHRKTGFAWWMRRMEYCFRMYDLVRVDHFRGFDEYYAIPYGDATAEYGRWEKGPGIEIFRQMQEHFGGDKLPIIAEDLGFLTPTVRQLLKDTGFPGMKVLEFAFDAGENSDYLPHKYGTNCVVYTGTHDNDTAEGWFASLDEHDRNFVREYIGAGYTPEGEIHWDLVRAALGSVADLAVIPVQDYLGYDTSARINEPSTLGKNWRWRMSREDLNAETVKRCRRLAGIYGRLGKQ